MITYKKDIIKEVSKELGIPEKEVEEIFDLNLKYIKQSVLEKDYCLIQFPNLCKIRLNYPLALYSSQKKNFANSKKLTIKINSLKRKLKILEDYRSIDYKSSTLQNFKLPLFERLWRKSTRRKNVKKLYENMYNTIIELEVKTNEIIEKISK